MEVTTITANLDKRNIAPNSRTLKCYHCQYVFSFAGVETRHRPCRRCGKNLLVSKAIYAPTNQATLTGFMVN
jgi:hypothetical protein